MQFEPKGARVSATRNVEGSGITYAKGTRVAAKEPGGICIAMAAQWIRGIYESGTFTYDPGVPPYHLATVLQAHYDSLKLPYGAKLKRFLESQNLSCPFAPFTGTCVDAFNYLRKQDLPVSFLIEVPGHALACYHDRPEMYYFDPNWGVYRYGTVDEFFVKAYVQCRASYCAMPPAKAAADEVLIRVVVPE